MAISQHICRVFKIGAFLVAFFAICISPSLTFAQNKKTQPPVSAISIARQIEELSLVKMEKDSIETTTAMTPAAARKQTLNALTNGNRKSFDKALENYRLVSETQHSVRDQNIVKVFTEFSAIYRFESIGENYIELVRLLEGNSNNDDWLVSFHAKRLLSIVHTHSLKYGLALRSAQEALDRIPNELSPEAAESRILAVELLAYLQNLTANKDLALVNTQRLLDLKLAAGEPIDGIELLNNLMFSLSEWRDYDTRLVLAQTINRLEHRFGSTTPGLSSVHIAKIYNDTGNYKAALKAANEAISEAKLDTLRQMATIQLATASAGLGQTKKAESLLTSININPDNLGASAAYAYALIALNNGNKDEALSLLNGRYDRNAQKILKATNRDTMEVLADLENSSERQAEREASLQREAELIQTKLDQQQRINKLLTSFLVLVALSGLGALLFGRQRDKLAKLLAIKSHEAESADRMKTEFLGMVSHELRTPLNGIIGLADILASSGPTEEVRHRGEIILDSGNALFKMIESIIDMSRLEAGKLELEPHATPLKSYIEENLGLFKDRAAEKNLLFTTYISPECDQEVDLDSARVGKCIGTLLCNAIKFTTEGRVHMHVTSEKNDATGQTEFTVIVADTGQGISDAVQTKLFTPFLQADASMTRKHGGSGLRLAISRMLARMMDGDITVTSREGRGSEFTLTFKSAIASQFELAPRAAVIKEETPQKKTKPAKKRRLTLPALPKVVGPSFLTEAVFGTPAPKPVDLSRWRALIVEDNPTNQDVIALMLETAGLQYVPVESGEEALNILNTQRFDFVLMDIHMPGIDGVETTRRIRAGDTAWANIPILALTADSAAENNAACMAAGANMFLTKPVLTKDLIQALREMQRQIDVENTVQIQSIKTRA